VTTGCRWLIIRCLRKPSTSSSGFGRRNSSTAVCRGCGGLWHGCLAGSAGGLSVGGRGAGGLSVGGLNRPLVTPASVPGACLELDTAVSDPSLAVLFCQQSTTAISRAEDSGFIERRLCGWDLERALKPLHSMEVWGLCQENLFKTTFRSVHFVSCQDFSTSWQLSIFGKGECQVSSQSILCESHTWPWRSMGKGFKPPTMSPLTSNILVN